MESNVRGVSVSVFNVRQVPMDLYRRVYLALPDVYATTGAQTVQSAWSACWAGRVLKKAVRLA
ncbi:hypothetical protein PK69_01200 [Xanthomonas phaseoli pv. phaseoli]|uniref:Uncharacterized protein n=1 Tax=Xanthomonas campestris pv. phaseoli TaxID=317013 RepID=A0AB34QE87_XANCH|nr:hypothetical protein AC609_19670 [Xanthomonas phaseoli pv. phaseoli]AZU31954.1 hypothetical protein AC801_19340 [Xanthomonas sp. ISO98C4]AZU27621.1 hypothetical protein AC611_19690 [Xanthomonas phaseoli pv. phaseoli]AZU36386.1 hypothetical protein AC610_19660 [Xanthomonas phaseoli pv. phaseoli]KGT50374.1 hypothetical protein NZ02_14700 [Xanthomonas phaseoli pv. phaseoli]